MTYWFNDPGLKSLIPLASASAIGGLTTAFGVPKIFMGVNAFSEAPAVVPGVFDNLAAIYGRSRAFVVTDEHADRHAARVSTVLERTNFATQTWGKAEPEAPLGSVRDCAESMKEFEPDLIVAVGGGSVIDTAKAAWILYERPDLTDLATVSPLDTLGLRKKALFVAVPTTSGTGSECTAVSVVTDTEATRKIPIASAELVPDYALLVPTFTVGMPPELTAGTGLDALTHAMDSVMSPTSNDFTEPLALRAIQMVFEYLPRAYRDGTDHEARFKMHMAASIAGIAFGNGGVGLTHSLGHAVGKFFAVHHGVAVGVFIPYALQFYSPVTDKYLATCEALGVRAESNEKSLAALIGKVSALFGELNVPLNLKDLGIPKDEFERHMDKLALYAVEDPSTFQNPRPVTMEQCQALLRCAYEGKDVDF